MIEKTIGIKKSRIVSLFKNWFVCEICKRIGIKFYFSVTVEKRKVWLKKSITCRPCTHDFFQKHSMRCGDPDCTMPIVPGDPVAAASWNGARESAMHLFHDATGAMYNGTLIGKFDHEVRLDKSNITF